MPKFKFKPSTNLRGSGNTTEQLLECKPGDVFVWCNDTMPYIRDLVRTHQISPKVRIVSLSDFLRRDSIAGLDKSTTIHLDHAIPDCVSEATMKRVRLMIEWCRAYGYVVK